MRQAIAVAVIILGCAAAAGAQGPSVALHFVDFSSNTHPAVLLVDGHRVCAVMFPPPDECVTMVGAGRHQLEVIWPNEPDPERVSPEPVSTGRFTTTISGEAYYFCAFGPAGARRAACQEYANSGRMRF